MAKYIISSKLRDVHVFEKNNNISINVFGLKEKNSMFSLKVCETPLPDHRNLLLLSKEGQRSHYAYISNFERMIRVS